MPTLDEQFKQQFRDLGEHSLLNNDRSVAEYWFLAGAVAERGAVLAIIAEYRNLALGQTAIHLTADAQAMLNEFERRIRQRGEEGK